MGCARSVQRASRKETANGFARTDVHLGMSKRKAKTVEQVVRDVVRGKPARKVRTKSEADVWYKKMLAEYVADGGKALASAKAKMKP